MSSNHTDVSVQCCHGKHTVVSSRTFSHLVYLYISLEVSYAQIWGMKFCKQIFHHDDHSDSIKCRLNFMQIIIMRPLSIYLLDWFQSDAYIMSHINFLCMTNLFYNKLKSDVRLMYGRIHSKPIWNKIKFTARLFCVSLCYPILNFTIYLWLYKYLLDLGRFLFSFLIFYTDGRIPWTGDQPVGTPLPTHRTAQTQNKRTHTHDSSGIGTHDPSVWAGEDSSCLHYDRHWI
jgi:hypothetical protein